MQRTLPFLVVSAAVGLDLFCTASAQGLPKTQPKFITIIREEVKVGRNDEHARLESGWPAALRGRNHLITTWR